MNRVYELERNLQLRNINILDVDSGTALLSKTIYISNGVIAGIHDHPAPVEIISKKYLDCEGIWALPGLIDSHVHLFSEPQESLLDDFRWNESYNIALNRALNNINTALNVGITTVRDAGAYSDRNNILRDYIESNLNLFPFRIISCGSPITAANGHFEEVGRVWRKGNDLTSIIDDAIGSGADYIKVMNDDPMFTVAQLIEITNKCHSNGLVAACHAFTETSIEMALKANFDTIEHAFPFSIECAHRMASQRVNLCPTYVSAKDSVSSNLVSMMVTNSFPDCSVDELKIWKENLEAYLPIAFQHGIRVIAGTDAGTFPTDFDSIPREIASYIDLGLDPLQAIQTATIDAARALKIDKIVGSIDKGKSADIVLLGDNPLKDFKKAFNKIKGVISRGYLVTNRI